MDGTVPSAVRTLEVRRLGTVAYPDALALQADLVTQRRSEEIPDQLLLLQHPHVITLGASSDTAHVLADAGERARLGIELHEVGRGGDVTYHGPGQLVGYPILDLKPDRKDLHRYLRDLEAVLIDALEALGVDGAGRREGLTGVWLPTGKVAAIGVRVSSGWITSHGFALNVAPDLAYFRTIVPCGIDNERVTSVSDALGRGIDVAEVEDVVVAAFARRFGRVAR
ncbi:MAG: lipoyl(octanoyl) transferase LipB [Gemmatimonadetes bacterium]|nr:lipoyl(octanoyl) transferase LipB [Gemmatimonadota bacterium]